MYRVTYNTMNIVYVIPYPGKLHRIQGIGAAMGHGLANYRPKMTTLIFSLNDATHSLTFFFSCGYSRG